MRPGVPYGCPTTLRRRLSLSHRQLLMAQQHSERYDASMPATRRRRIVRRAVMALAVAVLLPVGYVGSVASFCFVWNAGMVPKSVASWPVTMAYIWPLDWYMRDVERPGAHAIHVLIDRCNKAGIWFSDE